MLNRLLSLLFLTTGGVVATLPLMLPSTSFVARAQTEVTSEDDPEGLYYTFYNQRILLSERPDQIAVQFVEQTGTRGGVDAEPGYLQLQRDLEGVLASQTTTRGGSADDVEDRIEVDPLGEQYALITLPGNATTARSAVSEQLNQSYVAATLPVLTRADGEDSIVVTSEIVVSFSPDTTEAEAAALIAPYGLEIIRALRFSQGRYLVSAPNAEGGAVLAAANQLESVVGVQSATPNFVQSIPYQTTPDEFQLPPEGSEQRDIFSSSEVPTQPSESLPETDTVTEGFSFPNKLLPFQWYLNSMARRPAAEARTDVYALEAWQKSEGGEDVTVAVIDSLIQWDHPDLIDSVYRLPSTVSDPLPGEVSGWDFSNPVVSCVIANDGTNDCVAGDSDTRISNQEVDILRPFFEDTLLLSDSELLTAYSDFDEYIQYNKPDWTEEQRASYIRNQYQSIISAEFHGTWSAGVITARPQTQQGMVGVAPNTKFLPVRVFGLGGSITSAALIEASGYAAARGADVINFSLGGSLPDEELNAQLTDIMARDQSLVIVASAGNNNIDRVSFPAAMPELVAVGATNLSGNRSGYSSYGAGLDVVAPGGETYDRLINGIVTAGGTWAPGFWTGISGDDNLRLGGPALDPRGEYVSVQGTSFSAPIVSGIVALMKDADENGQLSRAQLVEILEGSADYDELVLSDEDAERYAAQSGKNSSGQSVAAEEYFFGRGLVNAEVAVDRVRAMLAE